MYAVVNTGGKQAKVEQGSLIAVEKLDAKVGATVSLPVLMIADGDRVLVTPAELAGARVTAEVLEHFKGEKAIIFKFKKRKGYKRTKGHRQVLTSVRILDISIDGAAKAKKADKPEVAPQKTDATAPKKPEVAAEKPAPAAKKPEVAAEKPAPAAKKPAPAAKKPEAPAEKPAPAKKPAPAAKKAAAPAPKPAATAPKKAAPAKAAEPAQCAAIKSDGTRCANKAKEGSEYCGVHAKQ